MKKTIVLASLLVTGLCTAQSVIQTVNSGSVISTSSSVSVGEIVVIPVNPSHVSSGLIGILSQVNQTLEVAEFQLTQDIAIYPNPTVAGIYFKSAVSLTNEKVAVYTSNGQLAVEKTINADNAVDLSELASGIYIIQISDKKSFKIIKH